MEQLLALDIELGYCARPGEVDLRTIGAPAVLDEAARIIEDHLGPHIVTRDQRTLEKVVVDALTARHETLAVARRVAAGPTQAFRLSKRITHRITDAALSFDAVFAHGGRRPGRGHPHWGYTEGITAFQTKREPSFTGRSASDRSQ